MKHLTPTLGLLSITAAASAQLVPVVKPHGIGTEYFSVGATYSHLSGWGPAGGANSTTIDARASIDRNFFLTAAYTGMSAIDSTTDPSSWALGFGAKHEAGNGAFEFSYAYRQVDIGAVSHNQNIVKVGYSLDLGRGLDFGLAVMEVFNESAAGGNVTAPVASVSYKFAQGLSANVSYSTENTVYGLKSYGGADAGKTLSFGVRYSF